MNKKVTFRNLEATTLLEEHVNKQLQRVERLLNKERLPISIEVILEAHRTHAHHRVEVRLNTPEYNIIAHDEGNDMYKVVNSAIDKLHAEVLRAKEKWVDKT